MPAFRSGRRPIAKRRTAALLALTTALLGAPAVPAGAVPAAVAGTVTVSGTVADGSGHGWGLYARLDVTGVGTFFTDPATGRYSFPAPANATYHATVRAIVSGYAVAKRDLAVGATDTTANVALPVDASCTAPGYAGAFADPLYTQGFDDATAPAGWTVVNRTATPGWTFTDDGARGNLTGGTGGFAIVDSDQRGSGTSEDTDLVSPPLDLSGARAPYLRFNSDFRAVGVDDVADVDVSVDGGQSWANVWHDTTGHRGPVVEQVGLGPAAGSTAALIRFHYVGSYDWWWEVDDVNVANRDCAPVPGGLLVGVTTDKTTGAGLVGVTVTSDDAPGEHATSVATPDDAALPDGYYQLFSSLTGDHSFTAAKPPYTAVTKTVTVNADTVTRLDDALRSGRVAVKPTAVGTYQAYGSVQSTSVTITNTGTAPIGVDISERSGAYSILRTTLSKQGAAPATVKASGAISKAFRIPAKAAAARTALGAAPVTDGSWTSVADYPAAVYDNAAVTLNGTVYSVGGSVGSGYEQKAYRYDPVVNSWSALPDLPTGRTRPQAVVARGQIYVFGGWSVTGQVLDIVDVFDPASGQWSTLTARNPKPSAAAGVAVAAGQIYLVGGCADADCTDSADVVRFDPAAGQFTTLRAYPHPTSWLSCGGIGAEVYCAGGVSATAYTDGFRYTPATDQWSPIADMPLDLWASAHASANGLLVIMGGVTGQSTALTNRTIAYDPGTDAWLDLPDAQYARFRAAGSCGGYKIGGTVGADGASRAVERLSGLDDCTQGTEDVPWLAFAPAAFTLAAGASRTVTVTLSATPAAGVTQPGKYTALLAVRASSPYPVPSIPVEMNVLPPTNAGKTQGTVHGQPCRAGAVAVPATLRFNPVGGSSRIGVTVVADASGAYAVWLSSGQYDVIVAKDGWTPQVRRVTVTTGFIATFEPVLDPLSPC